MTDTYPFAPDYCVMAAYEITDMDVDDFNDELALFAEHHGQRGVVLGYLLLWVRVGLPQRLNTLGLDAVSSLLHADSLLSYMTSVGMGLTQGELHNIFPEFGRNHALLALSREVIEKVAHGLELLSGRVDAKLEEERYFDGEELWECMNEFDEAAQAIGRGIRDSLEFNPFHIPDYAKRAMLAVGALQQDDDNDKNI